MAAHSEAPVRSADQDAALQLDTLRAAGSAKAFVDRPSGPCAERPRRQAALDHAREGGLLVT